MSNPVSNSEVEDVLSSIRRLVSEDKRPQPGGKSFEQNANPESDRLVLTPSLRVAAARDTPEAAPEEAQSQDEYVEENAEDTSDLSLDALVTDDVPLDVYAGTSSEDVAQKTTTEDIATDYSADPYNFDDPDNVDGNDDAEALLLKGVEAAADAPEAAQDYAEFEDPQIEDAIFEELSYVHSDDDEVSDNTLTKAGFDDDSFADDDVLKEQQSIEESARRAEFLNELAEAEAQAAEPEQVNAAEVEGPVRRGFLSLRPALPENIDESPAAAADMPAAAADMPAAAEDMPAAAADMPAAAADMPAAAADMPAAAEDMPAAAADMPAAAADMPAAAEDMPAAAEDMPAAADDASAMPQGDAPHSEPVTPDDTDVKAAALSAKIAALETAIGKISDTWEPDDAGESEYAGTAAPDVMEWEDDVAEENPFARRTLAPVLHKLDDIEEPEASVEVDTPEEDTRTAQMNPSEDAPQAEAAAVEQRFTSQRAHEERLKPQTIAASSDGNKTDSDGNTTDPQEPFAQAELKSAAAEINQYEPLAEPETQAEPLEAVVDEAHPDEQLGVGLPDEEQLLDEEALRDLVSEIVRAELQGALGERITRNVRKLVRREIHRALTAQELE